MATMEQIFQETQGKKIQAKGFYFLANSPSCVKAIEKIV